MMSELINDGVAIIVLTVASTMFAYPLVLVGQQIKRMFEEKNEMAPWLATLVSTFVVILITLTVLFGYIKSKLGI